MRALGALVLALNFGALHALAIDRRQALAIGASALASRAPRARAAAAAPPAASDEPEPARRLLAACGARRPGDFTDPAERARVDALVEEVVALKAPWKRERLLGKWRLAYLQPGPDGAGVDRRVPFPELPFNDSFQIFGEGTVTNVGELLGPLLSVRVSGGLSEDDRAVAAAPKRFRADITGGGLCVGADGPCAPLPIRGEGIFDGQYLGARLRIGQNLNGGGARIVQVRVE